MSTPTEDDMRTQMHNTMSALERMANAVTEHLTADKQPAEQNCACGEPALPGPHRSLGLCGSVDYSSLQAVCKNCQGVVAFKNYDRDCNSGHDTCTCDTATLDDLDVPSDVRAVYTAIHAQRCPPIVACPGCRRPTVVQDPTKLCVVCLNKTQNKNWKKEKDADFLFEGDVVVKGDLRVEGTHSAVVALTPGTLDRVIKVQEQHRKALAILATFAKFAEPHASRFFGLDAAGEVQNLVMLKACATCVGSGWVARDETCRDCNGKGYKS